ncbi:MAG: DUF4493 domain-containing protein [Duncaniella sp.]|nr:DUF4493 domain-containing protein [Duncaniella sp.]
MTIPTFKIRALAFSAVAAVSCLMGSCDDYDGSSVEEVGRVAVSLDWERHLLTPDGTPTDILIPLDTPSGEVSLTMEELDGDLSHTWEKFSEFPQGDIFLTGRYRLTAVWGNPDTEGYEQPAYTGELDFDILPDRRVDVTVPMTAAHTFFNTPFEPSSDPSGLSVTALEAHTPGGVFHDLTAALSEPAGEYLCLHPGPTSIFATVSPGSGLSPVRIEALTLPSTTPGALYTVTVELTGDGDGARLTVGAGGRQNSIDLTRDLLSGASPTLNPSWNQAETYEIAEGEYGAEPFTVAVTPGARPLRAVNLSVTSTYLTTDLGFPAEVNLLAPIPSQETMLAEMNLDKRLTPDRGGIIDLSEIVSRLVYLNERCALSTFTVEAVDDAGISAEIAEIKVRTLPVELDVTVPEPSVICVDRAKLHIVCPASNFASNLTIGVKEKGTKEFTEVPFVVEPHGNDAYDVRFDVPSGTEPVEVCVYYCDEVRTHVTVERVMPDFEVKVDPYASMAELKIVPADPTLTEAITERLLIRINGNDAPLYSRRPKDGILTVIGLQPSTEYTIQTTLVSGPDAPLTPKVTIETEPARQLPNCDFEDPRPGPRYEHLPSGGRYSQTTVEIFNWQHHTDISEEVPAGWANTNSKTFNKQSRNHNTWYMQPSVALTRKFAFTNAYSVRISSVAFDLDGEEIPDYAQTGQPFLDYSPIVPHIAHRAAGRLFIGTYSFDYKTLAEVYDEGMAWNSRPQSMSGRYRFIPTDANRSASGLARIEVLGMVDGKETVIAGARQLLTLASDFTTFNIPLEYNHFGVKATRIKVMFASSADIGTIAEETAAIVTLPDPKTATSTGGQLWIDNITLGY